MDEGIRVAINAASVPRKGPGIRRYLVSLLEGFADTPGDWKIEVLCTAENRQLFSGAVWKDPGRISLVVVASRFDSAHQRILFDQQGILRYLTQGTILLTPSGIATLRWRSRQVCVLQSALMLRHVRAEEAEHLDVGKLRSLYYDKGLATTARRAARLVAVSDYMKEQFLHLFPHENGKIVTIREGVNLQQFGPGRDDLRRAAEGRNVLFIGTLYPYKGAEQLIRAFARIGRYRDASADPVVLNVAGRDPDGTEETRLRALALSLGIGGSVNFFGEVDDSTASRLYRGASALTYPSMIESFGLPPLEAMASGLPVIASNRGAIPEVVGGAGILVEPTDAEQLASAIARVLDDELLRETLVLRGFERARQFSWCSAAQEYVSLFQELVAA